MRFIDVAFWDCRNGHLVQERGAVKRWEAAGHPPSGNRPKEGVTIAQSRRPEIEAPLVSYAVMPPCDYISRAIEELSFMPASHAAWCMKSCPQAKSSAVLPPKRAAVINQRLAPMGR